MDAVELLAVLRRCAGVSEHVTLDESAMDKDFEALGYDSLALLEAVGYLQREYAVAIEDDAVGVADNPRRLLDLVNAQQDGPR